jgi:hypothetical protein
MINGVQAQNTASSTAATQATENASSTSQTQTQNSSLELSGGLSEDLKTKLAQCQQNGGAAGSMAAILATMTQLIETLVNLMKEGGKKPISRNCECPGKKDPGKTEKVRIATPIKKTGQFLWKPVSDKDGKLAVLLPSHMTGKVKDVTIYSPDGKTVIEKGKDAGVGNGDREHFRFSKPGGKYPDGAIVLVTLDDGTKRQMTIKKTEDRTVR